ncbi:MAG: hypothetical protein AABX86_01175, partial [Nanoarchaeota archaeon]
TRAIPTSIHTQRDRIGKKEEKRFLRVVNLELSVLDCRHRAIDKVFLFVLLHFHQLFFARFLH